MVILAGLDPTDLYQLNQVSEVKTFQSNALIFKKVSWKQNVSFLFGNQDC